jgi:hypothetical protein
MDHDPYDLEHLRVEVEAAACTMVKRKKWRRHYVRVPWAWVEHLRSVKAGSTWHLAHVLLYEHWRTGGKPIVLSNVAMREEGIKPRSKSRGLVELTKLGLITVERKTGRSPRITVHHATAG